MRNLPASTPLSTSSFAEKSHFFSNSRQAAYACRLLKTLKTLALSGTAMTYRNWLARFTSFRNSGLRLMEAFVVLKTFRRVSQFAANQKNPGKECNSQECE